MLEIHIQSTAYDKGAILALEYLSLKGQKEAEYGVLHALLGRLHYFRKDLEGARKQLQLALDKLEKSAPY